MGYSRSNSSNQQQSIFFRMNERKRKKWEKKDEENEQNQQTKYGIYWNETLIVSLIEHHYLTWVAFNALTILGIALTALIIITKRVLCVLWIAVVYKSSNCCLFMIFLCRSIHSMYVLVCMCVCWLNERMCLCMWKVCEDSHCCHRSRILNAIHCVLMLFVIHVLNHLANLFLFYFSLEFLLHVIFWLLFINEIE